jgi:hypothetical protein
MAKEDAASTLGKARVVSFRGTPAYLIPEDAAVFADGESQKAPGMVTFISDSENVTVVGHLADEDLIRIAGTIVT